MVSKASNVSPKARFVDPDMEGFVEVPLPFISASRVLMRADGTIRIVERNKPNIGVVHTHGKYGEVLVETTSLSQFRMESTDLFEVEEFTDPRTPKRLRVI